MPSFTHITGPEAERGDVVEVGELLPWFPLEEEVAGKKNEQDMNSTHNGAAESCDSQATGCGHCRG
jgi:ABC-type taurine transport system ATPase subunit